LRRINWSQPNLAWAIDATEYGRDRSGRRLLLVNTIDLASRFTFPPLVSLEPDGEQVAGHLRTLFARHGLPLLLKRDNGGVFNHHAVDQLLAEHAVIPLNSPAYYPRYNGAIEKAIRELKGSLHHCLPQPPACWEPDAIARFAEAAAHLRNCTPRRCLRGLTAAQAYHHAPRSRFTKAGRHVTFLWIKRRCAVILGSIVHPTRRDSTSAWRLAIQLHLQHHKLITIHVNKSIHINHPVSPLFHLALLS
jgi:transposase InsO family protein